MVLKELKISQQLAWVMLLSYEHTWKLTHYFPEKWQVIIDQNYSKCLIAYQRLSHEVQE